MTASQMELIVQQANVLQLLHNLPPCSRMRETSGGRSEDGRHGRSLLWKIQKRVHHIAGEFVFCERVLLTVKQSTDDGTTVSDGAILECILNDTGSTLINYHC